MIKISPAAFSVITIARLILSLLLLAAAITVTAFAQTSDRPNDVDVSWRKGTAYVPWKVLRTSPPDIATDKTYPVVIYMHGCGGIASDDNSWGYYLKELGYIVVLPDSMRRDRPRSCDPRTLTGGLFPDVQKFRHEEMNFAREQVEKAAWADKARIFLMGFSEGGQTVAQTTRTDFRGIVISAYKCRNGSLRTAIAIPLLAIDHGNDPWYPGVPGGACARFFGGRQFAEMVNLNGSYHATFETAAKEAVQRFLSENSQTLR